MRNRGVRTRAVYLSVIAALLTLTAACGVPSFSGPIIDGSVTGRGGGIGAPPHALPDGPSGLNSAPDLVDAYLKAIAGQTDPVSPTAKQAVQAFMTDDEKQRWTPSRKVTVVRLIGSLRPVLEGTRTKVAGTYQIVGVFSPAEGTLEALQIGAQSTIKLSFLVTGLPPDDPANLSTSGLRVDSAPEGTYMSEQALTEYYQPHSIYFWDSANEGLIPELRYVPLTVSRIQRETLVVNWVLSGSDALGAAAARVVNTTLLDPQVQEDGDRVIVDVASSARFAQVDKQRLGDQLRWSLIGLGPEPGASDPPPVDIYVDRQEQYLDNDPTFVNANVVSKRVVATAFVIAKGVARPLDGPQIAVLNSPSYNTNVRYGAVSSGETKAALVRSVPGGGVELWIRRGNDKAHDFVRVASGASMTRPVWLAVPDDTLAIVIDGKLCFFDGQNRKREAQLNGIGSIKAMSVAPEGRRIALVTDDGGLFVSVVSWQSKVPSMQPPRQLQVQFSAPTAVAWSKTDQLAVAGRDGDESKLLEVNSDGSEMTRLSESFGSAPITAVVAYPLDGLDRSRTGPIMFETSSGARLVRPAEGTVPLTWGPRAGSDLGNPVSPFYID